MMHALPMAAKHYKVVLCVKFAEARIVNKSRIGVSIVNPAPVIIRAVEARGDVFYKQLHACLVAFAVEFGKKAKATVHKKVGIFAAPKVKNRFFRAKALRRPNVQRKFRFRFRNALCRMLGEPYADAFIEVYHGEIKPVAGNLVYYIFKIVVPHGIDHKLEAIAFYFRRKLGQQAVVIAVHLAEESARGSIYPVFHFAAPLSHSSARKR